MDMISKDPVPDVKIVLSGPNRFRSILTMDELGEVEFPRLEPGDYFIIFEKKEFKFAPNKLELNLTENKVLKVNAERYQFSILGKLSSLSNAAFPDYEVEGKFINSISFLKPLSSLDT
jgi:hypothetical protein